MVSRVPDAADGAPGAAVRAVRAAGRGERAAGAGEGVPRGVLPVRGLRRGVRGWADLSEGGVWGLLHAVYGEEFEGLGGEFGLDGRG